jgi:hypothetical protein
MYAQQSSASLRGSATRRRYAASVSGEHPSLRRRWIGLARLDIRALSLWAVRDHP